MRLLVASIVILLLTFSLSHAEAKVIEGKAAEKILAEGKVLNGGMNKNYVHMIAVAYQGSIYRCRVEYDRIRCERPVHP